MNGRGWAYAGAVLGGAVSVAANVAHSYVAPDAGWPAGHVGPEPGAVGAAVFWPVALLVAVEILARVAWPDSWRWTAVRFAGLLPVALLAAFVSYRHLSGLLTYYSEDAVTSHVGPLAVDGLMVLATAALLATSGLQAATPHATAVDPVEVEDQPAEQLRAVAAVDRDPAVTVTVPAGTGDVPPGIPPGTRDRIAALLRDDPELTGAEIARRVGVSTSTVSRHVAALSRP